MASKRVQNQLMDQTLQIARWTPSDVERWFIKKKYPISIFGAFRMKWKIDGKQLLDLEPTKIKLICAATSPSITQRVLNDIKELQNEYDAAVDRARRCRKRKHNPITSKTKCRNNTNNEPPFKRRKRMQKKKSSNSTWYYRKREKETHDRSCSGEVWDECTLREAWFWYLPPHNKNFGEIAKLLRRTEVAVLTRINLIRRAIKERPEMESAIRNPLWKSDFSLRMVVSTQAKEEKIRYQEERMRLAKAAEVSGYEPVKEYDLFEDELVDELGDDDAKEESECDNDGDNDGDDNGDCDANGETAGSSITCSDSDDTQDTTASVMHENEENQQMNPQINQENQPRNPGDNDQDDDEKEEDEYYLEVEGLVRDLLNKRYLSGKQLREKVAEILDINEAQMIVYYKDLIHRAREAFYSDDEEDY